MQIKVELSYIIGNNARSRSIIKYRIKQITGPLMAGVCAFNWKTFVIDRVNIFNVILLTTFTVCRLGEIRLKSETRKLSVPIIYTAVILYIITILLLF